MLVFGSVTVTKEGLVVGIPEPKNGMNNPGGDEPASCVVGSSKG